MRFQQPADELHGGVEGAEHAHQGALEAGFVDHVRIGVILARGQRRRTTSSSSMPLASLTSVANSPVMRRRTSSFGNSTLRSFSNSFGS